jgi:arylsulfatase A
MFYWTNAQLHAVRRGPWKLHLRMREAVNYGKEVALAKPELYHVEQDISEKYNLADKLPQSVEILLKLADEHLLDIDPHDDMLAIPIPK